MKIKAITKSLRLIVLIITFSFFITFCVSNREVITISFFPLPLLMEIPLFLLIIFSIILGVILDKILRLYNDAFKVIFKKKKTAKVSVKKEENINNKTEEK